MSTIHFLNVGKGDCTIIQHGTGRVSMIDICKGNFEPPEETYSLAGLFALDEEKRAAVKGDFGMSKKPTNPLEYLSKIGVKSLFRFILTHPDMDHLDGLDALMAKFSVANFWDSGVRKTKPAFGEPCPYNEKDWDRYQKIVERKQAGITVVSHLAGSRFHYANKDVETAEGGDGLNILAPDAELVKLANENEDVNDGSYVLMYRIGTHKIIIPGDAHDETWDYVIKNYRDEVANCTVLFAPHHGRKSGRSFSFLDTLKPKITFFGCAESGHLAYNSWSYRNLPVITNNQAGNIVMECLENSIEIYVENASFAESLGVSLGVKNALGYTFLGSIS